MKCAVCNNELELDKVVLTTPKGDTHICCSEACADAKMQELTGYEPVWKDE